MNTKMPPGVRVRKALLLTAGLSFVVCVAFLDVQMHHTYFHNRDESEWNTRNESGTLRTLMQQRPEKKSGWIRTHENTPDLESQSGRLFKKEIWQRRLPDAIIIGVKKGGTRALLEILRLHPDVVAPGPEIHFFDRHYRKGLSWYRSQMPLSSSGQLTVEKTPGYLVAPDAPWRVYNMSGGQTRLLLVVRDPVTRALSDYAQAASKRPHDTPSFEDVAFRNWSSGLVDSDWTGIRLGQYARHLERWARYFPSSRIHVVSGEGLVQDPVQELKAVQQFLGLRPVIDARHFFFNQSKGFPCLRPAPSQSPRCLGKTKGRSHPPVAPAALQRLRDFFRPFNQKFYSMVNRDFGWP